MGCGSTGPAFDEAARRDDQTAVAGPPVQFGIASGRFVKTTFRLCRRCASIRLRVCLPLAAGSETRHALVPGCTWREGRRNSACQCPPFRLPSAPGVLVPAGAGRVRISAAPMDCISHLISIPRFSWLIRNV